LWDISMIALSLGGLSVTAIGLLLGVRRVRRGTSRPWRCRRLAANLPTTHPPREKKRRNTDRRLDQLGARRARPHDIDDRAAVESVDDLPIERNHLRRPVPQARRSRAAVPEQSMMRASQACARRLAGGHASF